MDDASGGVVPVLILTPWDIAHVEAKMKGMKMKMLFMVERNLNRRSI